MISSVGLHTAQSTFSLSIQNPPTLPAFKGIKVPQEGGGASIASLGYPCDAHPPPPCIYAYTLQRTNTENSKQIFPEKELLDHSPNSNNHVPVSDLYIPTIDLPIFLQEICGPILEIYKSLTDTKMWKWPRNSQKSNT